MSDGRQLFACVTPEDADVVVCIDEHALCDDVVQCPNGEDEDPTVCMFHRLVSLQGASSLMTQELTAAHRREKPRLCNYWLRLILKGAVM